MRIGNMCLAAKEQMKNQMCLCNKITGQNHAVPSHAEDSDRINPKAYNHDVVWKFVLGTDLLFFILYFFKLHLLLLNETGSVHSPSCSVCRCKTQSSAGQVTLYCKKV